MGPKGKKKRLGIRCSPRKPQAGEGQVTAREMLPDLPTLARKSPRKTTKTAKRIQTPSPERAETPSPDRAETPSPERVETPSPERAETPSPERRKTPSPDRGGSPHSRRTSPPPRSPTPPTDQEADRGSDQEDRTIHTHPRRVVNPPKTPRKDRDAEEAGPSDSKRKRRANTAAFPFTPQQEKDLAEWFREHPQYYNKRLQSFKNKKVKDRMLEDKAKDFTYEDEGKCTVEQLNIWLTNMRTYFGRLTKPPASGSGGTMPHKLTDREEWIKTTWTFLNDHIVRKETQPAVPLTTTRRPPQSQSQATANPQEEEETTLDCGDSDGDMDTVEVLRNLAMTAPPVSGKGKGQGKTSANKGKKDSKEHESDMESIEKICTSIFKHIGPTAASATAAPAASARAPSPDTAELENFARDIVASMHRIPKERWNDVKGEMMNVIRNYSSPTPQMGLRPSPPSYMPSYNPSRPFPSSPSVSPQQFQPYQQNQATQQTYHQNVQCVPPVTSGQSFNIMTSSTTSTATAPTPTVTVTGSDASDYSPLDFETTYGML